MKKVKKVYKTVYNTAIHSARDVLL